MVKISSIFSFFCLIGCLYQIYDITELFLQHKVRRDVVYDYSAYIEIPAIDITVPTILAMNLPKLFAAYPKEMSLICAEVGKNDEDFNYTIDNFQENCEEDVKQAPIVTSEYLAGFIKVKDIKEFSVDLYEQLDEIKFTTYGDYTGKCNSTRYYSGVAIIMRLICLNGTKPISIHTNYVSMNEGVAAMIKYSFGTHFGIRFSNHTDLPVFEQSKYFIIDRESGSFSLAWVSFVKTVMSSLEYPYETNCRFYNKAESIAKCMTEYSFGQSTPYLFKTLTYEWDQHPDHLGFKGKIDQLKDNEINSQDDAEDANELGIQELDAVINCTNLASAIECEKTNYVIEGENTDQTASEFGVIMIEPSWKANLYLSVHPVLPLSEYVIFIGSICSIWFGISIHDRILVISNFITTKFIKLRMQMKRTTIQMNTKLNENQRSIQRKSRLKSKIIFNR